MRVKVSRLIAVGVILGVAMGLRLWRLDTPDITPDEYHYIHEAERLAHGDPYISIRHHPFAHIKPHMGHPFLAQILTAGVFKLLGQTIVGGRLVSVLAGVAAVGMLMMFGGRLGRTVGLVAAATLAMMPLAVRYNRSAYLDSLLTVWVTLVALAVWRFGSSGRKWWLVTAGVAAGLAISNKLDGVVVLAQGLGLLGFVLWEKTRDVRRSAKKLAYQVGFMLVPAGMVVILLNDPGAYLNGILEPADARFSYFNASHFERLAGLVPAMMSVGWVLVGSVIVGILAWVLVRGRRLWGEFEFRFVVVWLATVGVFVLVQQSEYAWLPILPAIAMLVGYQVVRLKSWWGVVVFVALVVGMMPNTLKYGWRLEPLPYGKEGHFFNRTMEDTFYARVVGRVNQVAPERARVFLLPQSDYPDFALRTGYFWGYSGDPSDYDVWVVGEGVKVPEGVKLVEEFEGMEDGKGLKRWMYVRE